MSLCRPDINPSERNTVAVRRFLLVHLFFLAYTLKIPDNRWSHMVQGSKITCNHVRQEMVKQSLTPTALDTNAWLALKRKKIRLTLSAAHYSLYLSRFPFFKILHVNALYHIWRKLNHLPLWILECDISLIYVTRNISKLNCSLKCCFTLKSRLNILCHKSKRIHREHIGIANRWSVFFMLCRMGDWGLEISSLPWTRSHW